MKFFIAVLFLMTSPHEVFASRCAAKTDARKVKRQGHGYTILGFRDFLNRSQLLRAYRNFESTGLPRHERIVIFESRRTDETYLRSDGRDFLAQNPHVQELFDAMRAQMLLDLSPKRRSIYRRYPYAYVIQKGATSGFDPNSFFHVHDGLTGILVLKGSLLKIKDIDTRGFTDGELNDNGYRLPGNLVRPGLGDLTILRPRSRREGLALHAAPHPRAGERFALFVRIVPQ